MRKLACHDVDHTGMTQQVAERLIGALLLAQTFRVENFWSWMFVTATITNEGWYCQVA